MCYFLYGAVDKSIDREDYEAIAKTSIYRFNIGTKHDVKNCILNKTFEFHVTGRMCDCDFPVGNQCTDYPELKELAALMEKLRDAKDAKYLYLSKSWIGRRNKSEEHVRLSEVETMPFLATMKKECLYQIDLR